MTNMENLNDYQNHCLKKRAQILKKMKFLNPFARIAKPGKLVC